MNVFNQFMEKIKHKNKINSLLYEDINDKLLSKKESKTSLNLLLSTRPELRNNINKIKSKYGYSQNIQDQEKVHHQISQLKNKYIKNSTDKYKINNVNIISYVNKDEKRQINSNESFKNYNERIRGHSIDLGKIRNNTSSFYNNNIYYEKEKILSMGLSSEQLMNNINNSNINDIQNIKDKKESDYENYVKNTRNDFYIIDKKVNVLNGVKKEIKIVNKNYDNTINNSSISQFSGSFTTIGFKYINPKLKRRSVYNDIFGSKNDEYGSFYFNEISKDNELEKPILIRGLSKPKLEVMRFSRFYNIREE